ncbi:hypothetical protein IC229_21935 [Spirosoma sp. BT702]|uniref:Uncharacterized protein n=2 Tax=Spirosoma profusum TaxID=2771354 RepID=A0A926XZV5_9BACT|nr:hypothetical protein [Spirosoma profusum]
MLSISVTASAQKSVSIQLSIVSRQASSTISQDVGLLLEAKNQLDQDVALYTPAPKGNLMRHVKYYKLNSLTNQYIELKHPLDQELEREKALTDSLYRATGAIVDFFGQQNYNSKSELYQQFVRDDSLWYDYDYKNTQYAKTIRETDLEHFSQVTGLEKRTALFTLMKAKERCQDFTNITFLYQQPGDYKIALELPEVDLHGSVCRVGQFYVNEPKTIRSNELYLRIR